jgi:hypothetical protein
MLLTHLRLGLPSGLFPSGFPTNNVYTFLFSPLRGKCPTYLILILSPEAELEMFLGSRARPVCESDNFVDICESIVQPMWGP